MKTIDTLKDRLIDITLPVAPPPAEDYTLMLTLIAIFILAVSVVIFFLNSRYYKNRHQLTLLRKQLASSEITPKQASYALAAIVMSARQVQQLTHSNKDNHAWSDFVMRLSSYRYSQSKPDSDALCQLIEDAKQWLKTP